MNTTELRGDALDWTVGLAQGFTMNPKLKELAWISYSTDWAHGGPIIEREGLSIERDDQGTWFASYDLSAECAVGATGATPLEAAMRCYVARELGDDVRIPEGL